MLHGSWVEEMLMQTMGMLCRLQRCGKVLQMPGRHLEKATGRCRSVSTASLTKGYSDYCI